MSNGPEHAVRELLQYVGEDPDRGGLRETPTRYVKALRELTSGYGAKPGEILKCFDDGAERYDQMIVVREIPFYSLCEHHLAPFFGKATIAYVPAQRIVGLSKLARLLDAFARRLQVQERLTTQVAEALMNELAPVGCGVVIAARHLCMESRGIQKPGAVTVTSALHGKFVLPEVRQEFLALADGMTP